jgi:cytoskeletal protein RodZ
VVGALLLILIALLVFAFFIRDTPTTGFSSSSDSSSSSESSSSSSSSSRSSSTTPTTASETTEAQGDEVADGDFTFAIEKVDRGDTITSNENEAIQKTATGEFVVVYINVGNTGSSPLPFVGAQQVLNADGTTYSPDTEATFYLGGASLNVDPGDSVEVPVAFDVPVGTTPSSISVRGVLSGTGVELPL